MGNKLSVCNQNVISRLHTIVKIYHSGLKPSKCSCISSSCLQQIESGQCGNNDRPHISCSFVKRGHLCAGLPGDGGGGRKG